MDCGILHLVIAGVVRRTSSDPSPSSATCDFTVFNQPLPILVEAFCFLAAPVVIRL